MINRLKNEWQINLVCILLVFFYLWGMALVPFHPDESTQIYMSQDAYDFIKEPLSLAYTPGTELTGKTIYRAIDMPLTRYLIGLARIATQSPGLALDWNWSHSWDENLKAGSYPQTNLLLTARLIPTLLIPLSIYLFYFSFRKILPKAPALIAVLLIGLNPLILLHCRRAMAESALLFGTALFLWAITRTKINPALVGLALALAFNAKQSGIFLVPVGIIAVCALPKGELRLRNMLARSASLLGIFFFITLLLNPFYWKAPFSAVAAGYQARAHLLELQLADHIQEDYNIFRSALGLIANIFISPPAISEIDKYLAPLADQIQEYRRILPHSWGRGLIGGSLQLTIMISAFFVLIKRFKEQQKAIQNNIILLFITTFCMIIGVLFFLPIPWQRYIIPILPLTAFWIGYGLTPLSDALQTYIAAQKTPLDTSK